MREKLNIETVNGDDSLTLVLTGDLVLKTAHIFEYITSTLTPAGSPKLNIDLREIERFDCIGLTHLVDYAKRAQATGQEVEALVRHNSLLLDPGIRLLSHYFTIHEEAL